MATWGSEKEEEEVGMSTSRVTLWALAETLSICESFLSPPQLFLLPFLALTRTVVNQCLTKCDLFRTYS